MSAGFALELSDAGAWVRSDAPDVEPCFDSVEDALTEARWSWSAGDRVRVVDLATGIVVREEVLA